MSTFTIPGPPVPKARARVVGRHAFTPARTEAYERKVALCARAAGIRARTGPAALEVAFYLTDMRHRDLDNLVKAVLDGLNGVGFADDSQVVEIRAIKGVDRANPRAEVVVRYLDEHPCPSCAGRESYLSPFVDGRESR